MQRYKGKIMVKDKNKRKGLNIGEFGQIHYISDKQTMAKLQLETWMWLNIDEQFVLFDNNSNHHVLAWLFMSFYFIK